MYYLSERSRQRALRDTGHMRELTRLVNITSYFIHELQKERGMSAVFLNSDGQQLAQELPSQRQLSNERLVTVRSTIASLDLAA